MATSSDTLRLNAIVEGRVQGVGFRYFVKDTADKLGMHGWVANRWDGQVALVAEGDQETLNKLVSALWKGPRMAFVTNVRQEWAEATGDFDRFSIRRSF